MVCSSFDTGVELIESSIDCIKALIHSVEVFVGINLEVVDTLTDLGKAPVHIVFEGALTLVEVLELQLDGRELDYRQTFLADSLERVSTRFSRLWTRTFIGWFSGLALCSWYSFLSEFRMHVKTCWFGDADLRKGFGVLERVV